MSHHKEEMSAYTEATSQQVLHRISSLPPRFSRLAMLGPDKLPDVVCFSSRISQQLAYSLVTTSGAANVREFSCDVSISPSAAATIIRGLPLLRKLDLILHEPDGSTTSSSSSLPLCKLSRTSSNSSSLLLCPFGSAGSICSTGSSGNPLHSPKPYPAPSDLTTSSCYPAMEPDQHVLPALPLGLEELSLKGRPTPVHLDLTPCLLGPHRLLALTLQGLILSEPLPEEALAGLQQLAVHVDVTCSSETEAQASSPLPGDPLTIRLSCALPEVPEEAEALSMPLRSGRLSSFNSSGSGYSYGYGRLSSPQLAPPLGAKVVRCEGFMSALLELQQLRLPDTLLHPHELAMLAQQQRLAAVEAHGLQLRTTGPLAAVQTVQLVHCGPPGSPSAPPDTLPPRSAVLCLSPAAARALLQPAGLTSCLPVLEILETHHLPPASGLASIQSHPQLHTFVAHGSGAAAVRRVDVPCYSNLPALQTVHLHGEDLAPEVNTHIFQLSQTTISELLIDVGSTPGVLSDASLDTQLSGPGPASAPSMRWVAGNPLAASVRALKLLGFRPYLLEQVREMLMWLPGLQECAVPVWPGKGMSRRQEEVWKARVVAEMAARRGLQVVGMEELTGGSSMFRVTALAAALVMEEA
jgi:hypothetical protein